MASLALPQNDQGQGAEADPDDHRKDDAQLFNEGHVLGMVGPHRLKGAPETVPDMKGDDDHGEEVKYQISLVGEDFNGNLKDGPAGLIHQMVGEIAQVDPDEAQDQQAGIGHGLRAESAAAAALIHGVPDRPGAAILEEQDEPQTHMND